GDERPPRGVRPVHREAIRRTRQGAHRLGDLTDRSGTPPESMCIVSTESSDKGVRMTHAVVVSAVRSPVGRGRPGGQFSELHPVELLSQVLRGLIDGAGIVPGTVDDVIVGCVSQVAEQSVTPGRLAWLASGYPDHVPATTIHR